jgi:hypothetical protein
MEKTKDREEIKRIKQSWGCCLSGRELAYHGEALGSIPRTYLNNSFLSSNHFES